jgi:hypothetical protein
MVALMPHSKLLQLLFPSYSSWDTVIYELRQYTRGASGCKAFEEFLVFLGRRGSNRKGTTLKLLRAAFGSSSRQGSMGYCCVQKAKYFEQKDNKNASDPDEGVAAMKGARFVFVDEFKGDGHFNATLVKQWCDMDGTPIPFEKKFGARDEIKPSWLMVWFTNKLPPFSQGDEAFARRPSIIPMYVQYKASEDFDPEDKTHVLADNSIKQTVEANAPELFFWIRCLVAGLYGRKDTTVLRPRPACVEEATAQEIEDVQKAVAPDTTEGAIKFIDTLVECGRDIPASTKEVDLAFASFIGIDRKDAKQLLLSAGLTNQTVSRKKQNVWSYMKAGVPMKLG